jgi:hypothetical protein
MIDPATGWFKIHQYDDKRAITVANIAEEEWFSRYPWPTKVTFDRGSEFIGHEFKNMFNDYGVKKNQSLPAIRKLMQLSNEFTKQLVTSFELLNSMKTILMRMILGKES